MGRRMSRLVGFLFCCSSGAISCKTQQTNTVKYENFEFKPTIITSKKPERQLSVFIPKVQFTVDGVATFFKTTFNHEQYGEQVLSTSLQHLTQFLEHTQKT